MTKITEWDYDKLDKMLSKVKLKLFYKKNSTFLSTILCNLQIVWDESIPTAATDEKTLYWNPQFFIDIPFETRIFVLAHEIWHCAYLHCTRRGTRNPRLWNIAADHVINTMLLYQGFSIKGLKFDIYRDTKYHTWSVDKVYEDLLNSNKEEDTDNSFGLNSDVLEPEQTPIESIGNLVGAYQAAKMAGQAGDLPGEIEETIIQFLNPILPWEVLLQQFLSEISNQDYTYARPRRRYDDPLLPGLHSDGNLEELNWYIDVSGSITDQMLIRFFSEMVYVKETFNPGKVNIIQFDTRITKVIELEHGDELKDLKVHGRGGTSLVPVYEHIMKTKPNAAIIFSDMECDPMKEVPIHVIWAMFGRPSKYSHKPTFGQMFNIIE